MQNTMWSYGRMVRQAAAVITMLAPVTLPALSVSGASRFEDLAGERRVRLALDLDRAATSDLSTSGRMVSVGGRMPRGVLLYRFRIVAIDAGGAMAMDSNSWDATILVGGGNRSLRPLMFLGSSAREMTLPRPLGYRLDAGDSVVFVATRHAAEASAPLRLELVIDYESGESSASRLAVTPLPASETIAPSGTTPPWEQDGEALWTWTPDCNGRILAIAGLPLEAVRELSLEDLTTGERLWSTTVRDADGRAVFGKPGDVVRLGVAVEAGHTYAMRATLWTTMESRKVTAPGGLLAMVLPSVQ